jgi:hypothetical protein
MQRIVSYLEDDIVYNIKKLYKDSDISISKMTSELIDIGYKVKLHHELHSGSQEENKAALVDKHTEYLLKIMAIVNDIYRCVRNEKSKYAEGTVDEVLATIHTRAQVFINKELEKSDNN